MAPIFGRTDRRQLKFARALFGVALALPLLVALPSKAAGVAVADATPAQRKSADKKLQEGQKHLKAGKMDKAVAAFEAAHDIVADPKARLLLARAYQNQGDLLKAHASFTAAVEEAEAARRSNEAYRETLQDAKKELNELEGVLAKLTIHLRHAPEGTEVTIDGEPLGARRLGQPILLPPGMVEVRAQTQDGREASRQVSLSAGQDAKVDLAFVREDAGEAMPVDSGSTEAAPAAQSDSASVDAPSSGSGKRTAAFIAGGVGVAGLAAFGVLGAMSNAKYNDLEDACPNARCPADQQDKIDDGKRFQTLANIGLAVGIVGVGASATLFWLSRSDSQEKKAGLELRLGLSSVELRGRFE